MSIFQKFETFWYFIIKIVSASSTRIPRKRSFIFIHNDETENVPSFIHPRNTQFVNYICVETRRKINKQMYTKANQRNFYHSIINHSLVRPKYFPFIIQFCRIWDLCYNFGICHSFRILSLLSEYQNWNEINGCTGNSQNCSTKKSFGFKNKLLS